jgi:hypothetical protein
MGAEQPKGPVEPEKTLKCKINLTQNKLNNTPRKFKR